MKLSARRRIAAMLLKRVARAILAIAVVSGGIVAFAAQPASAVAAPLNSHFAKIVNLGANKCLDVVDGSKANGARIQLWSCASSQAQQKFYSGGYSWINTTGSTSDAPQKCLDVTDGNPNDLVPIQQWKCASSQAQQNFRFVPMGTGDGHQLYEIRTTYNKCLDATGYGTANGTRIQQYTCTGALNQLFWVELW